VGRALRIAVVDGNDRTTTALSALVKELAPCWRWQSCGNDFPLGGPPTLPDVVLTNIPTPNPAGLASLRSLKALLPTVPLIVLMGDDEIEHVIEFIAAGASGCLVSPAAPRTLARVIEDVLQNSIVLCPRLQAGLVAHIQRQAADDCFGCLSCQERKVACLLAHWLSDREIAARLGVARVTVHSHLAHIYLKLGVHSREGVRSKFRGLG
jgi:DNA-binding NarL/FixJ family response regulator